MKLTLAILLCCLDLLSLRAADTTAPAAQRGNRFLFILQTTTSMSRAAKSAHDVLVQVISSGALGQMKVGDTFGIWTYNDTLSPNRFPMHQWAPDINFTLGKDISDFLDHVRYEKEGDWKKVWAPLTGLIKSSRALTVVLITDGLTPMQGTPFDQEINELYQQNAREMRAAKMPFVTALIVRNGDIVDYAVNSTLGPLQIPNPPLPRTPSPVRPATNNVASPATQRPSVPAPAPIIITNDAKSDAVVAAVPTPAPTAPPITPRVETPAIIPPAEKSEPPPATAAVPVEKMPAVTQPPPVAETRIPSPVVTSEPVIRSTTPQPIPAAKPETSAPPASAPERRVPAQQALVPTPPPAASRSGLLIPIIVIVGAVAIGAFLFLGSRRKTVAPSLISRSMGSGSEPPPKK